MASKKKKGSIYTKLKSAHHVRSRPDAYIGSISKTERKTLIYNMKTKKIKTVKLNTSFGMIKIIDEILDNAFDHAIKTRTEPHNYNSIVKNIKITINVKKKIIRITNDGPGIPPDLVLNGTKYLIESIFTDLRAGHNFNDDEVRYVSGRNGFGAKLTTIFSKYLNVITITNNNIYKQQFQYSDAEKKIIISKAIINNNIDKEDQRTTVEFSLNNLLFKDINIKDIIPVIIRKCKFIPIQMGNLNVIINGNSFVTAKSPENNLKYFIKKYILVEPGIPIYTFNINKIGNGIYSHKVAFWVKEYNRNKPFIASYSNGSYTEDHKSNIHVKMFLAFLRNELKKLHPIFRNKKIPAATTTKFLNNNISFILISIVDRPIFDSQIKTKLTKCTCMHKITNKDIKSKSLKNFITHGGLLKRYKDVFNIKMTDKLKGKNILTIMRMFPKYESASNVGKKNSNCSLLIIEGDSAQSSVNAGFTKLTRDIISNYGKISTGGKPTNVLKGNNDFMDIKSLTDTQMRKTKNLFIPLSVIIGLEKDINYKIHENRKKLKYKKIILFSDADYDGFHINGLTITCIYKYWKSLLEAGLVYILISPVIRIYDNKGEVYKEYMSMSKYEEEYPNGFNERGYSKPVYFKGLASNSAIEIAYIFKNIDKYLNQLTYNENSEQLIFESFKKNTEARKRIINTAMLNKDMNVDNTSAISIENYLKWNVHQYFKYSSLCKIANINDGFCVTHRKIIYTIIKMNIFKKRMKVMELSGLVSKATDYMHGDSSLNGCVVNLAQTHKNNIPLLNPYISTLGTRTNPRPGDPRYSTTQGMPYLRKILRPEDDGILKGDIEKIFYPIIPLTLINGMDGVGSGIMTKVPRHNVKNIILRIKNDLRTRDPILIPIIPYYNQYRANHKIKFDKSGNRWYAEGIYELIGNKLNIYEMSLYKCPNKYYKGVIMGLTDTGAPAKNYKMNEILSEKHKPDYNNCPVKAQNGEKYDFCIYLVLSKMYVTQLSECENTHDKIIKDFKLIGYISRNNYNFVTDDGKFINLKSENSIYNTWFRNRLNKYKERKEYTKRKLLKDKLIAKCKMLFIKGQLDNTIILKKRKLENVIKQIIEVIPNVKKTENYITKTYKKPYSYLYKMPVYSVTIEKYEKLKKLYQQLIEKYNIYINTKIVDIWHNEVSELEKILKKHKII